MLDPGKRKCGGCYDNQKKYGWPIPNCSDPDGTGEPCPYPTVITSLRIENQQAWQIWAEMSDQLVNLTPMSEPTFTLNLESLRYLLQLHNVDNPILVHRKVREVFRIYQKLILKRKNTKTERQFSNVKKTRAKVEKLRGR